MIASLFLALVAFAVALGHVHAFVLWFYLGMSLATFAVYAVDKSAARNRGPRTPENSLHVLALLGGWPGALYAQQLLRHKTRKGSFLATFWLTLAANVAALLCFLFL